MHVFPWKNRKKNLRKGKLKIKEKYNAKKENIIQIKFRK